MSRTLRRLPLTGGGIKRYAVTHPLSSKRQGNCLNVYKAGHTYVWGDQKAFDEILVKLRERCLPPPDFVMARHKTFELANTCTIIDTDADVMEWNARETMNWCRKNGTCKRQRQRGVRMCKRLASRQYRAGQKSVVRADVVEAYDDDIHDSTEN